MFEALKLAWDVFVLRKAVRDGDMTAGTWIAAGLFLLAIMAIGLPTIFYYDRHPDADAHVMIEAAIPLGVVLIIFVWVNIAALRRKSRTQPVAKNPEGQ